MDTPKLLEQLNELTLSADQRRMLVFMGIDVKRGMKKKDLISIMDDLEERREEGDRGPLDDWDEASFHWDLMQGRSFRDELGIHKPGKDLYWKAVGAMRSKHGSLENFDRDELVDEMLKWHPTLLRKE